MLPSCARVIETSYSTVRQFKNLANPPLPRQWDGEHFTEVEIEDELPTCYDWENPERHFTELASAIDRHALDLFRNGLQGAICEQLQIPVQRYGCTYQLLSNTELEMKSW